MTDLTDPIARAEVTARLGRDLFGGRPIILGPFILAGATPYVGWLRELGSPVLVVSTSRGAGAVPAEDECVVVEVVPPATTLLTEELRTHDRLVRELPEEARTAIDAFDPERRGVWLTTPFVTTDEPVDGRPVLAGRPAVQLALEDKMLADAIWDAAEVPRAAYALVPVEDDALAAATAELASAEGAIWTGDARDGYNGLGDYVRWIGDESDAVEAAAFFKPRCDRVRVMPFLDGVPCSIHGFVLPDGTAALRPVEIVMLRNPAARTFTYAGLGTTWDPPAADREEMRTVVRRVGAHLQSAYGYRGAFGIDGVLTADGFRPTELNSRMSAGATVVADIDRRFFTWLQAALVAELDTGLTAADVEALVPLMDAERAGRVNAFGVPGRIDRDESYPVTWDGASFARSEAQTGNLLSVGLTPTGMFAKVDPCAALRTGERLAPVNAALLDFLDRTYGTGFGPVEPAPDLRTG